MRNSFCIKKPQKTTKKKRYSSMRMATQLLLNKRRRLWKENKERKRWSKRKNLKWRSKKRSSRKWNRSEFCILRHITAS